MRRLKSILFQCLLLSLPVIGTAQTTELPTFVTEKLDDYVVQGMKSWDIPGVAICIVKDGKAVYMKGFGKCLQDEELQVDENTLFMIASNSKSFTATALCMLVNDDLCSLDDKAGSILPDFKMDASYSSEVTLRDLMTHKLGLKTFQGDFMYFYSNLRKEEVYEKFSMLVPMQSFRQGYGYCNAGYFFAGQCIEEVSGISWEDFLTERIFRPLDMDRTQPLSDKLGRMENVAWGHTLEKGKLTVFPHANIDVIGPAAGISTSVNDISHWLIAQLAEGKYNGRQVIPADVIQMTRQPQTIIGRNNHPFNNTHYSLYGLGWSLEDYEGVEVISHGGGIRGFYTDVAMVPELNLGIAVFTNTDENWFYEGVRWEIIDAFLKLPYRNYSEKYLGYYLIRQGRQQEELKLLQDSVAMKLTMDKALDFFAGKYTSTVYGQAEITEAGDHLLLRYEHHPDLQGLLQPLGGMKFMCSYKPSRFGFRTITFLYNEKGSLKFITGVADRLEKTTYEFVKEE